MVIGRRSGGMRLAERRFAAGSASLRPLHHAVSSFQKAKHASVASFGRNLMTARLHQPLPLLTPDPPQPKSSLRDRPSNNKVLGR